jgi:hypothetical protein
MIEEFLLWAFAGIIAVVEYILRSMAKEVWILIRAPFEIISSYYQLLLALGEFQERLQISQYGLTIINSLTSQPLLQGILQSISPFANLIWLLCGGYIFFKIVLPIIADAL